LANRIKTTYAPVHMVTHVYIMMVVLFMMKYWPILIHIAHILSDFKHTDSIQLKMSWYHRCLWMMTYT